MSIVLNNISAGYDGFRLRGIDLEIKTGSLTALIGPNGCGKSTLLKAIGRILPAGDGRVEIGGQDISKERTKAVARKVAVLPQHPVVPPGITVEQLIGYGRAPHQNLFGFTSSKDREIIEQALTTVSLVDLRKRLVSELSGGQRQRAFIAMSIAQDTPYVLFDEPTSFLDIRYQYEVLDLLKQLNSQGRTCVVVLHDIAQAARYATDLVIMKDGAIHSKGSAGAIITPDVIQQVYGISAHIYDDPVSGTAVISPHKNGH